MTIQAWVRLYTLGLPTRIKHRRVTEIDSDLWEEVAQWREGGSGILRPPRILIRMLRGAPSDALWRLETGIEQWRNEVTTLTSFHFADSYDNEVYAGWHGPLLEQLFSDGLDFHWSVYERTHQHRREHNGGEDEGHCGAWPSPPYRAPVWQIVANQIGAKRFLEVGTGLGYTAALMADAGGSECRVDTIEIDPVHADIAEAELGKLGLLDRVRILRGDSLEVLRNLDEPYDIVFSHGGGQNDVSDELRRLTRQGGAGPDIKSELGVPLIGILTDLRATLADQNEPEMDALPRARQAYRSAVFNLL